MIEQAKRLSIILLQLVILYCCYAAWLDVLVLLYSDWRSLGIFSDCYTCAFRVSYPLNMFFLLFQLYLLSKLALNTFPLSKKSLSKPHLYLIAILAFGSLFIIFSAKFLYSYFMYAHMAIYSISIYSLISASAFFLSFLYSSSRKVD